MEKPSTSVLSFSVNSRPELVTLQRSEVSLSSKHKDIVWVPFLQTKKRKLPIKEPSYEYEAEDEGGKNDIYRYFRNKLHKTSHVRRGNKLIMSTQ